MKKTLIFLLYFCLSGGLVSVAQQSAPHTESVLQQTDVDALKEHSARLRRQESLEKQEALARARQYNWPIRKELSNGRVIELIRLTEDGRPVYFLTQNRDAAETVSTHKVWPGGATGLNLTGQGFRVGMWDDGQVRTTHRELAGRVTQKDYAPSVSSHATAVAGNLVASGLDGSARGMAYEAALDAYDFNNFGSELSEALSEGLLISNHSFTTGAGWTRGLVGQENQWVWLGDPNVDSMEDYKFGYYDGLAQQIDEFLHLAPYHLVVVPAGNDRGEMGPAPGQEYFVFNPETNTYQTSTAPRKADGRYDCITGVGLAKNGLTVGAVHDLPEGYRLPSMVRMSSFSSWGPTDDGRIKPDICGNGVNVYTSSSASDNSYDIVDGTSIASPNVAGSLVLLQELYAKENNGAVVRANTLKALAIHTADEAGQFPGPDYSYGWGVLNTAEAAEVIKNTGTDHLITEGTLREGDTYTVRVKTSGGRSLVATIVWNDPAGSPAAKMVDPQDLMLVNDLDMRVEGQGHTHQPWVLNPALPTYPASRGDNFRDNVEQVFIDNPIPGEYVITIRHKGNLTGGAQNFSLVVSGITGSFDYCSGNTALSTLAGSVSDGSGINNYANNTSCQWLIQPQGATQINLKFDEFSTERFKDWVRIYDGATTDAPLLGIFSGNSLPPQLTSSGGAMLVEFESDETVTSSGWSAQYTSFTTPVGYCNGTTTLTAPSGMFSDGSGTENYVDGSLCKWLIQPPGADAITLDFTQFNVFDVVYVFDGATTTAPLLGQFSGNAIPPTLTSSGGAMLVYLETDEAGNSDGFTAHYRTSCTRPNALGTGDVGSYSALLQWTASSSASAYAVEYRPNYESVWYTRIVSGNSYRLMDLQPETVYQWRVRSICDDNSTTAWSETSQFMTDEGFICAVPINLNVDQVTVNDVEISWRAANRAVEYEILYNEVGFDKPQMQVFSPVNSVKLGNLNPATQYTIIIRSICPEDTYSDWSAALEVETLSGCSYPRGLTAERGPTETTVTATWRFVGDANRYEIGYKPNRIDGIWRTVMLSSARNSFTFRNLVQGEEYLIRVRSRCGHYATPWSPEVPITTEGLVQTQPANRKDAAALNPESQLEVFPNPTRGLIQLSWTTNVTGDAEVAVRDLTGRQVHSFSFSVNEGSNVLPLDLATLPKGVYILSVNQQYMTRNVKIVLE